MTDTLTPTPSTLDLVDFETVRDDGVIETPETYTRLVELTPRPWLTASETTRNDIYAAFTRTLRGVRFPIQFLTYTSSVPITDYLDRFEAAHSPRDAHRAVAAARDATVTSEPPAPATRAGGPPDRDGQIPPGGSPAEEDHLPDEAPDGGSIVTTPERTPLPSESRLAGRDAMAPDDGDGDSERIGINSSPILAYGQLAHAQWVGQTIQTGTGRDRQYFVAVAVRKDGAPPASRSTLDDLRYTLQQFLPTRRDAIDPETEQQCLTELRSRAQQLAAKLPNTGVETAILTDRPSVLAVLYQYYHAEPARVTLDHAWLTHTDRNPDIDPTADASTTETETESPRTDDDPLDHVANTESEPGDDTESEPLGHNEPDVADVDGAAGATAVMPSGGDGDGSA